MFAVYLLVVLGTFVEGELVLMAALYLGFSETLPLSEVSIGAAAFLGAFLGDWFFFELGRKKGAAPLTRWPRLAARFDQVAHFLARYPSLTILLLRFQIACRMIGNYSLGRGALNRVKYLLLNAVACLLWVLLMVPLCHWFFATMTAIWRI